jgi:hypothetical protein
MMKTRRSSSRREAGGLATDEKKTTLTERPRHDKKEKLSSS